MLIDSACYDHTEPVEESEYTAVTSSHIFSHSQTHCGSSDTKWLAKRVHL